MVAPRSGTDERYADAMGELWAGITRTLVRLDEIADEPARLGSQRTIDALRRLQYRLHLASEQAYGLAPPLGAESAHAELREALASARDATAEVADTLDDDGPGGVPPLLPEWRGALFRVRLARLRLAAPKVESTAAREPERPGIAGPLTAFLLALGGAAAFAAGATLVLWPLWVAGLLAVCAAVLAYRP
jgi:hypothetical protein